MTELCSRAQNPLRPLDVGEARANGIEELVGVLFGEGEVRPKSRRDFPAPNRDERERRDAGDGKESNNGWAFHPRKFNGRPESRKARAIKALRTLDWRPSV